MSESRSYEVTATILPNNSIISVWMETRLGSKVSSQIGSTQISYKNSKDFGKTWSEKKTIDDPKAFIQGNPYLLTDKKGNTFLVLMSVNKDFFSGNLSFYEWNGNNNEFQLKSIPVSSKKTLIDKPALAISGNKIYLTYVEYAEKLEKSYVKYQYSSDNGKTWTKPKKITNDEIIYLGQSLESFNESLYLTFGTYWNKEIYYSKAVISEKGALSFQKNKSIIKISDSLGSAMTELTVNKQGDMAVGWLYNHEPRGIYISVSDNEGKKWTKPLLLSKSGNLLSLTFDCSGNLLCLYSEFKNGLYSVVVKKVSIFDQNIIHTFYLKKPDKIIGNTNYIGAFQKIIHTDNKNNFAFWIDYSKDNKLFFSKWQDP